VGQQWDNPDTCPTALSSDTNGSAPVGHVLQVSPREERSPEELARLMDEAARIWE